MDISTYLTGSLTKKQKIYSSIILGPPYQCSIWTLTRVSRTRQRSEMKCRNAVGVEEDLIPTVYLCPVGQFTLKVSLSLITNSYSYKVHQVLCINITFFFGNSRIDFKFRLTGHENNRFRPLEKDDPSEDGPRSRVHNEVVFNGTVGPSGRFRKISSEVSGDVEGERGRARSKGCSGR